MLKITFLKKITIAAIAVYGVLLAYFLLFIQYFQQDEWHGFGIILSYGTKYVTLGKSVIELLLGDRVGARIITFSLFSVFGLDTFPYGLFGLTIHGANALLIYILTTRLTKNTTISLLTSFLFLINEVGNEAYSWFGTMTGSLTSVFFFLLSLIFFLRFIDTKKTRHVLLSVFLLWFSFLFKEVGAFAFIFYPMLFLIYSAERKGVIILFKRFLPLIILGGVMLVFFAKTVFFIPGDRANYVDTGKSLIPNLFIHALQYPLEGVVQTIIPNAYLFQLSNITTRVIRPDLPSDSLDFLVATENSGAEITLIALLIIAIIIFFILWKRIKDMSILAKKTLFSSLTMTALSFLPYIVINRSSSYLDSRHYYLGSIGMSIFLAILIFNLLSNKNLLRFCGLLILISYTFIHGSTLFSDFKLMADRSKERRIFLRQVDSLIPSLKKQTVFFITGDSEGYYGLPELKTPFQSGLGHVLMIKYASEGKLNSSFFQENPWTKALDVGFLYDILGQGYRKIENQGFGYYYNKLELNKALDQNLFDKDNIIPLYYKHQKMELILKR